MNTYLLIYLCGIPLTALFIGVSNSSKLINDNPLITLGLILAWPFILPIFAPLYLGGLLRRIWSRL